VIPRTTRFAAGFCSSAIEVDCSSEPLAYELRQRLGHLLVGASAADTVILRLTLEQIEPDWIEIRDSTGRSERGQRDYVVHCARRWAIEGFIEAHPDFLWLHAAAAALDGFVVLLCGSPGAGKSTLAVQLVDLGWAFVADDVVPVDPMSGLALPLPCAPCIRTASFEEGDGRGVFLEQSKRVVDVASEKVAAAPQPIGAIVFPEFSRNGAQVLSPLSSASAARSLIAHCLRFDEDKSRTIGGLFRLTEALPAFHLRYCDPAATAAELTGRWLELSRRLQSSDGSAARRPLQQTGPRSAGSL
jgi:hypothetical protein